MKTVSESMLRIARGVLCGGCLMMAVAGCGEGEWSQETLDHYNVYDQSNAPGCPDFPGVYFSKADNVCTAFFPAVGDHITLEGNPSYRYSVPVDTDPSGQPLFAASLELEARCENHPKIRLIVRTLSRHDEVGVLAGRAGVSHPEAAQVVQGGLVCQLTISPGT